MSNIQVFVILSGIVMTILIAWYFWLLPEGERVTLEFTPNKSGEFGLQCQMGMLRGKLIVEEG